MLPLALIQNWKLIAAGVAIASLVAVYATMSIKIKTRDTKIEKQHQEIALLKTSIENLTATIDITRGIGEAQEAHIRESLEKVNEYRKANAKAVLEVLKTDESVATRHWAMEQIERLKW